MIENVRGVARRGVLSGGAAALISGSLPASAGGQAPSRSEAFAADIRLPGLLHAAVARPPLPGWRLDDAAILRLTGVVAAVALEPSDETGVARLGGVALLARDTWSALRARDALRPIWAKAARTAYRAPPAVFVPATAEPLMEPPCATAQVDADGCAVWTRTHTPRELRRTLAALLDLAPAAVAIHTTSPACGHGPSSPAYAIEAALLSRAMGGTPVSLTWTVADDLPFHRQPSIA